MKYPERSSQILNLAKECEIPTSLSELDSFDDKKIIRFAELYKLWVPNRDKAIQNHLVKNKKYFRVFIPYSKRVFNIALQIQWYVDEIIVEDPIGRIVNTLCDFNIEQYKKCLVEILRIFFLCEDSISSGLILFVSNELAPRLGDNVPEYLNKFLDNPSLVTSLNQSVKYGIRKVKDSHGHESNQGKMELDSGAITIGQIRIPAGETKTDMPIFPGESYPEVSIDEFKKVFGDDCNKITRLYPRELYRTLYSFKISNLLNSAILFDRELDENILSIIGADIANPIRQARIGIAINLMLPYLEGISHDRLLEVRNIVPDSFKEFRSVVSEIVTNALNANPEDALEYARIESEKTLIPSIRNLDVDLKIAAKKNRLIGYGLPVVAASGALIGTIHGLDLSSTLPMVLSGLPFSFKAAYDYLGEKGRVETTPFSFLWRARKN